MLKPKRVGYLDIKAQVLRRIRDNTWPPDTFIPGEIELAEEFGCARATVNRAMRELVEDGFLERKRKAGTRVKPSPTRKAKFIIPLVREEIEAKGVAYAYTLLHRELRKAPKWLETRLNLPSETDILHLQCLHSAGDHPFQFEDRWINLAAVPRAASADFSLLGPNEWLVNEIPFTNVELTFSAQSATALTARHLAVASGAALFTVERMTWLEKMPVTYAKLCFTPGYQMHTKV